MHHGKLTLHFAYKKSQNSHFGKYIWHLHVYIRTQLLDCGAAHSLLFKRYRYVDCHTTNYRYSSVTDLLGCQLGDGAQQ